MLNILLCICATPAICDLSCPWFGYEPADDVIQVCFKFFARTIY
jgi:hypothetical protein